jgi:hypothetical protein
MRIEYVPPGKLQLSQSRSHVSGMLLAENVAEPVEPATELVGDNVATSLPREVM